MNFNARHWVSSLVEFYGTIDLSRPIESLKKSKRTRDKVKFLSRSLIY